MWRSFLGQELCLDIHLYVMLPEDTVIGIPHYEES